jgi:uncharacterized SAM-binding protein YcdF (DUF218 family)
MLQDILFFLSKLVGPFSDPRTALYAGLVIGVIGLWTPWGRAARRLLAAVLVLGFVLGSAPLGVIAVNWIENLVPPPERMPANVDGIVVLGGDVNSRMLRLRPATPGADATRQIAFADLARRYPDAKLVFSGGSGQVLDRADTDADGARLLLPMLGLDPARVLFEDRSRNTHENATLAMELAKPKPGETWLLVTSAFHMPRSLASFRKAGWQVVPYPVGYFTEPDPVAGWFPALTFDGRMYYLAVATREIAGYVYYYVTGRTDSLIPRP